MTTPASFEIPLPSEHPGREDPSPASRDPLNALICALLDPYLSIEEIAENRKITVMRLGEILSAEPASSTIESLRKVFALRAELLALHARASAVGTLNRIANSGNDDEVARRAATTLLRMFRPDGTPAPLPPERNRAPSSPVTDGGGAEPAMRARRRGSVPPERDRAPDRGSERSGSSPNGAATVRERPTPHADILATSTPSRAAPIPPTAPSERGGPEGQPPLRAATIDPSHAISELKVHASSSGTPTRHQPTQHHHRGDVRSAHRLQHAHDPP